MKNTFPRKIMYAAGIVLLFIVISYAFVPEVLSGKIVNQADISGWTGMTNEVITYNEDPSRGPVLLDKFHVRGNAYDINVRNIQG